MHVCIPCRIKRVPYGNNMYVIKGTKMTYSNNKVYTTIKYNYFYYTIITHQF